MDSAAFPWNVSFAASRSRAMLVVNVQPHTSSSVFGRGHSCSHVLEAVAQHFDEANQTGRIASTAEVALGGGIGSVRGSGGVFALQSGDLAFIDSLSETSKQDGKGVPQGIRMGRGSSTNRLGGNKAGRSAGRKHAAGRSAGSAPPLAPQMESRH